MNYQHIVVLCSCADEASAARIAHALVTERLAACVNRVAAVRSTYSWRGSVEDQAEVLLVIKTLGARYDALEQRIRELHGYEVPEILALPVAGGSGPYLAWLSSEAGGSTDTGEDADFDGGPSASR